MEDTIIVDTDILVNLLRKEPKTIEWLESHKDSFSLATTAINIFELYTGVYKSSEANKNIKDVKDVIERFRIIEFNTKSAREAGKQRALLEKQGQVIDIRDIFIGAIAISENIPIKTNNIKHFSRIDGLKLSE